LFVAEQIINEISLPVIIGFVSAFLLTPLARFAAIYLNIVAHPNPLVKTHKTATPFLGGVAVYLALTIGLLIFDGFGEHGDFLLCAGLMTALGLVDDIKPLSALRKLFGQLLISILGLWLITSSNGLQINILQAGFYLLWLVVASNALNLIDVMDGLATGTAAIAFGGLFALAFVRGSENVSLISLTFCAVLLGFLPFNFHRARIFLGDAGSLMIGFSFGLLTLMQFGSNAEWNTFPLIMLLFAVPIFELIFVSIMRYLSGKPFWKGSRDHFSLRLLSSGWKVPVIAVTTYAFGIMMIIAALVFELPSPAIIKWFAFLTIIGAAAYVWFHLSKIKVDG
jgi:UDP-GlcNAc:undecaprenyl-phosphate GlcNAc-1-phosphate transferase